VIHVKLVTVNNDHSRVYFNSVMYHSPVNGTARDRLYIYLFCSSAS